MECPGVRPIWCALACKRHSNGIPVDAHVPELTDAVKSWDILLGKPSDVLWVLIGLSVQDELANPFLFPPDTPLVVCRVVRNIDVPSLITELPLEDPPMGWFFEFRVPWLTNWPSGFHFSCDQVERLREIDFSPTAVTAPGTGKDRKIVSKCEKSLTGPLLGALWGRWAGGSVPLSSRGHSMTQRAHRMERSIAPNTQWICRSCRLLITSANGFVKSSLEKASQVENSTVQLFPFSRKQKNITYAFVHKHELRSTHRRVRSQHSPNHKFGRYFSCPGQGRHSHLTPCTSKPL